MYTGNNPTAIQSMDRLSCAAVRLLSDTAYTKITIRNLCKSADVSRQTFYNLFDSKEEVLHYCIRNRYEKLFDNLADAAGTEISGITDTFIRFYEDNRGLIDCLIENHLESVITEELYDSILLYVNRFVKRGDQDKRIPCAAAMLAGALTALEVYLMKSGENIEYEKITELLTDFLTGKLYL